MIYSACCEYVCQDCEHVHFDAIQGDSCPKCGGACSVYWDEY